MFLKRAWLLSRTNSLVCSGKLSGRELPWITSTCPWPGIVTVGCYQFEISSIRHGCPLRWTCLRCVQSDEIVLCALGQCLGIADSWDYAEQPLSYVGGICLLAKFVMMIALPPSLSQASKSIFLYLVAVMWKQLFCGQG